MAIADSLAPNTFVAVMPLTALRSWAAVESKPTMDDEYGAGNWLRCRMNATQLAYLSANPCALLLGNDAGKPYAAPMSLLTSNQWQGPCTGVPGQPDDPIPGAAMFVGTEASSIEGPGNTWATESWQLRTRGYRATDLWNGCAGQSKPSPNFSGWLVGRITFDFS